MKTLTKLLATAAVLTLSAGVFAHMQDSKGGYGYMHSMMDTDSPEYQAMLEMRGNPEAMHAWMESMHENPQVMQEWMEKIHGENFANGKGGFGCHGGRFDNDEKSDAE